MAKQKQYADWMEARRFRAVDLHEAGYSGRAIAEALGVTEGAVSQWLKKAREQGREALRTKRHPGREPRLAHAHYDRLRELLAEGAEAHGFRGAVWTRSRVARLIKRHFQVTLSVWQVGRILRRVGYSPQKPVRRARERKEEAIAAWRRDALPDVARKSGSE